VRLIVHEDGLRHVNLRSPECLNATFEPGSSIRAFMQPEIEVAYDGLN